MHIRYTFQVQGAVSDIIELLQEPNRWTALASGASKVLPNGHVVLSYHQPRPMWLQLELSKLADGVRVDLLRGDMKSVKGSATVTGSNDAAEVLLLLELNFEQIVPGALLNELTEVVIPRLCRQFANQIADLGTAPPGD